MFKKISILLVIVLALCWTGVSNANWVDPHLKWKTINTPHFAIHHPETVKEIAQKAGEYFEEAYESLGKTFGIYPWGRTQIVLIDQDDDANGMATVIPYNYIIVRVVPPTADGALAYYNDWLRELVIHEYTHIVNLSDTGYPAKVLKFMFGKIVSPNALTPGWITEGFATFFETENTDGGRGKASFSDMMIRTDILRGKFLPIDKAAGSSYEWPNWMVKYIYGVKFWQYVAETYGKEKIAEFSHRMGRSLWFYSLNNKANKIFGRSFYRLWTDWEEKEEVRYKAEIEEIKKEGLLEGSSIISSRDQQSYPFISRGNDLFYVETSDHKKSEIKALKAGSAKPERVLKGYAPSQISVSGDGKRLVFAVSGRKKRYYDYNDIYFYDLEKKKLKRLTRGKRGRDPDFSPDGKKIVYVEQGLGASELKLYEIETKKFTDLTKSPPLAQYDHPRWSPDGKKIAVSIMSEGGFRDIAIYADDGKLIKRLERSRSIDNAPCWSSDSRHVYFSSDRSGIFNIYRYDLKKGMLQKVTNVTTGAFAPAVSPDGNSIVFQYYNGGGYELHKMEPGTKKRSQAPFYAEERVTPAASDSGWRGEPLFDLTRSDGDRITLYQKNILSPLSEDQQQKAVPADRTRCSPYQSRNYLPLKYLLPRYIWPNVAFIDGSVYASAMVGSNDPLGWHSWYAIANYRSDANYFGYGAGYAYARWAPNLFTGYYDSLVNFGDIFAISSNFYEHRQRAFGGVKFSPSPSNPSRHKISSYYFFEDRSAHTAIPAGTTVTPSLGNFAGLHIGYDYININSYPASISPESGNKVDLNYEISNSIFGSSENLEQHLAWGDLRQYIPLWWHHVFALRAAGGVAMGDTLLQGSFGLGGAIGESPFMTTSGKVFTLRGLPLVTYSRERAMVLSAEYRMPLFRAQRGIGTWPFFMNSAHFAAFADYGDAWNSGQKGFDDFFDNFLLGVGAELRGDFVLGYYLPVTGRIGYGIIVVNRDRVAGFQDPLTGMNLSKGILIMEVGTSF